jgi:regulator of replication initiation timing
MDLIQSDDVKKIIEQHRQNEFRAQNPDADSPEYLRGMIKELLEYAQAGDKQVAALSKKITKLETENKSLKTENQALRNQASEKNKSTVHGKNAKEANIAPTFAKYSERWTQIERLAYILNEVKKPMLLGELVDITLQLEPDLPYRVKNPSNTISDAVYNAIRLNVLARFKKLGSKGYAYYLPSWNDPITKELGSRYNK